MIIKLKNKFNSLLRISIFCLVISVTLCGILSCKTTSINLNEEEKIYYKPVHPREYYFDLFDDGDRQKFKKNKETKKLELKIDFTEHVIEDMPQAGDKLIFQYKFTPTKDIDGNVYGTLEIPMSFSKQRLIGSNLKKGETIEGKVSFILDANIDQVLFNIKLDSIQKSSWLFFEYDEVGNKTDIKQEIKEEKKALKKDYQIINKVTNIYSDYDDEQLLDNGYHEVTSKKVSSDNKKSGISNSPNDNLKNNDGSTLLLNQDVKVSEEIINKKIEAEKKQLEIEKKIEAEEKKAKEEKNRQEQEFKKQQQLLEETIKTVANTNVKRYEREYLDDYAVNDYTFDVDVNIKRNPSVFPDPDKTDDFGRTLLMNAAKTGNDWQIKALVNGNADVNMQDRDGWTALMYAVRYQGNMDCVELLINAGADIKITNNYGMSPLLIAANYNNNPEILKKLLSYYSPTDKDVLKAFVLVLTENTTAEIMQLFKVNLFLDMSVPLNSFYQGKTPLMYAAESGSSTKVIKLLLDNNSITSIRSSEGKTAFDYAKENPKLKHDDVYWSLNNK